MKIVIVGAGIAGMGAALALRSDDRQIIMIERDPPPPTVSMDELFDIWDRKGVAQLRHSHAFIAQLYVMIRDRYPALLEAMRAEGARVTTFTDLLPPALLENYAPQADEADMAAIVSRRTTLEFVMRRYIEQLNGVVIQPKTVVRDVLVEEDSDGIAACRGVVVETPDGVREELRADLIIDASGRGTPFPRRLAEKGLEIETEEAPTGITYFTRFYRIREGQEEPAINNPAYLRGVDLSFVKYAIFPADNGSFSVTLTVPEIEHEVRERAREPEYYEKICAAFPGARHWIDPIRSEPISKVLGMANLTSAWRSWMRNGTPVIKNFFAVGDASIRTNPTYGRGCTFGFMHAHLVADAIAETNDPVGRALLVETKTREILRPHFDYLVNEDAKLIERVEKFDPEVRNLDIADRITAALGDIAKAAATAPAPTADGIRAVMRVGWMLDAPQERAKQPIAS